MNEPYEELRIRQRSIFDHMNNIGVALIEKGCFVGAIAVFETLLEEAKWNLLLPYDEKQRKQNPTARASSFPAVLRNVATSVARLECKLITAIDELAMASVATLGRNSSLPASNDHCLEISTYLCNPHELEGYLENTALASAGMLIKISVPEGRGILSQDHHYELECAIVLYNLAVAYFLYVSYLRVVTEAPEKVMSEFVSHAWQLIRVSLQFLSLFKSEVQGDDSRHSTVLLVECLVLSTAAYQSLQQNQVTAAESLMGNLEAALAEIAWILYEECDITFEATRQGRHVAAAA